MCLTVLALVAVTVGVWGYIQYNSLNRVGLSLTGASSNGPQNFLIVGSDTRELGDEKDYDAGGIYGSGKDKAPGGQRADTIVIARVDPSVGSIALLSIPRDLWVTTSSGKHERINGAYTKGPQELVDVIDSNLGIKINHYVEVNFNGFKGLVEAIGGVPMYFDKPIRDRHTGLLIRKSGCVQLDPVQSLAFARSRYLEYSNGRRWVSDPTGDLGRITRQQVFLRRALAKTTDLNLTDVNTLRELIGVGVQNVSIDEQLGVSDMLRLAKKFAKFDASTMVSHRLSTLPFRTDGGADVLKVDFTNSRPALNIFQGKSPEKGTGTAVTTSTIAPSNVTLDVLNATSTAGLARTTADAMDAAGFKIREVGNTTGESDTTIRYPSGSKALAQLVAATVSPEPRLTVDDTLAAGHVALVLGEPVKVTATAAGASGNSGESSGTGAGATSPTSIVSADGSTPPTSGIETTIGKSFGDPPPGVVCTA